MKVFHQNFPKAVSTVLLTRNVTIKLVFSVLHKRVKATSNCHMYLGGGGMPAVQTHLYFGYGRVLCAFKTFGQIPRTRIVNTYVFI